MKNMNRKYSVDSYSLTLLVHSTRTYISNRSRSISYVTRVDCFVLISFVVNNRVYFTRFRYFWLDVDTIKDL